ncbi:MAG: hypothetical protein ACRDJP_06850, partial [Actinomycetota bacterium]
MHSRSFRAVRLLIAGLAVVSLAAACGGDDGDEAADDETTTTTEATTTTSTIDEAAETENINKVTTDFFAAFGSSDFDTAQTLLENGKANRPKMEHCNNIAVGVTVEPKTVEFTDAENAVTTFDILINGAVVLEGAGGGAVRQADGTWLVSE